MTEYDNFDNTIFYTVDDAINDYIQKYSNTNMLPKSDFIEILELEPNKDYSCYEIDNWFNFPEVKTKNDDGYYLTNVIDETQFIEIYNKLYSLKYDNDENIQMLCDFISKQTNINDDNIIKPTKILLDFMKFISHCSCGDDKVTPKKIKDQCGKDNIRTTLFLNNRILTLNDEENNYKRTDEMNLAIMKEMKKQNFQNIQDIYKYLIYIDLLTHQTIINSFTFDAMNKIIKEIKNFITTFYHYTYDTEISSNEFIFIEKDKLEIHRIKHCHIYNFNKIANNGYDDAKSAFKNGIKPDGTFTFHIIIDLLKNEYYIKSYLLKIFPERNDIVDDEINYKIEDKKLNNYNQFKEIISKNKENTAGTLLTLGMLSAIPLALLLGGKKTKRRFKGMKRRKTNRRRKTTRHKKTIIKKKRTKKAF
jgi:hypothetical protein